MILGKLAPRSFLGIENTLESRTNLQSAWVYYDGRHTALLCGPLLYHQIGEMNYDKNRRMT